jgi:hypothetical protein
MTETEPPRAPGSLRRPGRSTKTTRLELEVFGRTVVMSLKTDSLAPGKSLTQKFMASRWMA